jgi:hypothetical protein
MYEIWLAVNIAWEIAKGIWPALLVAALAWIALVVAALRRPGTRWGAGLGTAVVAGIAVMVASILVVPYLTKSSLAEMGYWVDWANIAAIGAGFGAIAAAYVWPLAAMRRSAATNRA